MRWHNDPLVRDFWRAGILLPSERPKPKRPKPPRPPVVKPITLLWATLVFCSGVFSYAAGVGHTADLAIDANGNAAYASHLLAVCLDTSERAVREVRQARGELERYAPELVYRRMDSTYGGN